MFCKEVFLTVIYLQLLQIVFHSVPSVSACHGELLRSGISAEEKQTILLVHNKLRQQVANGRIPNQPAATNMQEITWDDKLAESAQNWADNCQFRHDPNRTTERFTMGQNVAIIWSTAPLDIDDGDFPSRINNWFSEVKNYSFGNKWSPSTGHYSQVVWADTNLVGCGFSEYKDNFRYNKLYVCNYGPGGNVYGVDPYKVGYPACSKHEMMPSKKYQGLCINPVKSYAEPQYPSVITLISNSGKNFSIYPPNLIPIDKFPRNTTLRLTFIEKRQVPSTQQVAARNPVYQRIVSNYRLTT